MKLSGKVSVFTGTGRGLGCAAAEAWTRSCRDEQNVWVKTPNGLARISVFLASEIGSETHFCGLGYVIQ
jgi:hypothetical protein